MGSAPPLTYFQIFILIFFVAAGFAGIGYLVAKFREENKMRRIKQRPPLSIILRTYGNIFYDASFKTTLSNTDLSAHLIDTITLALFLSDESQKRLERKTVKEVASKPERHDQGGQP